MLSIVRLVVTIAVVASAATLAVAPPAAGQQGGGLRPSLEVQIVADGLTIPWDLAYTPDGVLLVTERPGRLQAVFADGSKSQVLADLGDLFVAGESGLMGLVLHPDFATNRRFYTCQAHTGPEVQVIGWTIDANYGSATRIADPLVGGLPLGFGRHAGCRVRFGADGQLWVGTGDAAQSANPQSLSSLGGKVLRVDPDTGEGVSGNPFFASDNANARRIYSYGHRNVQGLALRPGTTEMWTVEHGPSRDDEINRIVAGGNYGWDPGPGYNERVPMTDVSKFPNAIEAQFSTGSPTLAMAGGYFVRGRGWGPWKGSLAVASLKNETLRFFRFNKAGDFVSSDIGTELTRVYGRLRTPMAGPNGTLYVTTATGNNDKILKLTPTGRPIGAVDRFSKRRGRVRVQGWAIDPNRTKAAKVRVRIDGEVVKSRRAKKVRSDVAAANPLYGSRHGYSFWVNAPKGRHEVCVDVLDTGPLNGAPVQLDCKSIRVR